MTWSTHLTYSTHAIFFVSLPLSAFPLLHLLTPSPLLSFASSPMSRALQEAERKRTLQRVRDNFFLPPLIQHRYRLEEVIGEGSYGVVCSAVNAETGERVAVKRIMRVFEEIPEAMRTLRELKFLRLLKNHENIITIKDVLLPSDRDHFDDVFVVLELMPTDLSRVLRSPIELSPEHIRWLAFQLVCGIHYMHTLRVLHRDLKPSNILINAKCDLRIVDFGLSRAALDDQDLDLVYWTDYVATRWYRAPELIMAAASNYSYAIDMWSIGCIFAEMLNSGRPMFPGKNPEDQLELIINFCGTPSHEAIAALREPRARATLERMPQRPPQNIHQLFPGVDPLALDLLSKILEFDPNKRISAEQALQHEYLQMDTIVRGTPIDFSEFAFERQNLSISDLRVLFLEEIVKYHPDKRDMYLRPAEQPALRYAPQDQVSRFREAMVATQNGTEPPRAWDSMPNQRLTHYYEQAGAPPPYPRATVSQAGVVQNSGDDRDPRMMTASTSRTDQDSGPTDANMSDSPAVPGVTIRTSNLTVQNGRESGGHMAVVEESTAHDESLLMKYGKYSSVESATSAVRQNSGAYPGVAGRRVSETLDSMIESAQELAAEVNEKMGHDRMGT